MISHVRDKVNQNKYGHDERRCGPCGTWL